MEGSLVERGIGWYLTYEETMEDLNAKGGPWWVDPNPGHALGFSLGVVYVAWPFDFIPDHIPGIGYIDDAIILNFSTKFGGFLWDLFDGHDSK